MRRGEVWWANLGPPAGRRPVLLVSREDAYSVRNQFIVVQISSRIRGTRAEVLLDARDGLPKRCAANADVVYMVTRRQLDRIITVLSGEKMDLVDASLRFSLGLD